MCLESLIKRSVWVFIFIIPLVLGFSYCCEGASISGRVTVDPSAEPIEGVRVTAFNTNAPDYYSNLTDNNGDYTIAGLPAADYHVYTENDQGYINEWYDGATYCGGRPPFEETTPITVDSQNDISGIDFALGKAEGSISGRVSDVLTGEPLTGIEVTACDVCCNDALTDTDGHYTITGLGTGNYVVWTTNEQDYIDELYKDIVSSKCNINLPDDTEFVPVNSPNETPNIDFGLRIGDIIRGRVFDDITGEGIENVSVYARFKDELCTVAANTQTDGSGDYEIPGLAPRKYVVNIYNETNQTYASFEAYDNAPNISSEKVQPVEVVAGFATNNIDFGMPVAQSISGTVSGVDNETYLCIVADSSPISYFSEYIGPTCIVGQGDYTLTGLHPDGTYSVFASLESLGYVYYDNTFPFSAEPVLPLRDDINFNFDIPGCVEGKITDAFAVPIPNIEIALFDSATGELKNAVFSDSSGEYQFNYLLPNTYTVKVYSDSYCSEVKTAEVDSGCIEVNFELVTCTVPCINIRAGEGTGGVGDTLKIPIAIENLQNQSFYSSPEIGFDNKKLELTTITPGDVDADLFNLPFWQSNFLSKANFYAVFTPSVQEAGILANLHFTILDGIPGEEIPLPLYEGPACEISDGKIIVVDSTNVSFDITPDSLNLNCTGKLRSVIFGTEAFDVKTVNPDSLSLTREGIGDGVAPISYSFTSEEKQSTGDTPFEAAGGEAPEVDIILKFRVADLVEILMLKELAGQTIPLILKGQILDGSPIRGQAFVTLLGNIDKEFKSDFDCDADVDGSDTRTFKDHFGRSSLQNPCSETDPCDGNYDQDSDVDGNDAFKFKSDYGIIFW